MKNALLIFIVLLANVACKKECDPPVDVLTANATIQRIPYACGPACDAVAWVVVINDTQESYVPRQLADEFKMYNHPVKITFKKTGEKPGMYQGPQLEYIEITAIEHR
jgi:hypothetical protein